LAQQPHTFRGNNERAAVTEKRKTVGQYFIMNDGYDTAAEGAIQGKKSGCLCSNITANL